MKKRVVAAFLGVMLSVSMGLEVPAAALDAGFESGFTSEEGSDGQDAGNTAEVQPSDDGNSTVETPASEGQQSQEEVSDGSLTDNDIDEGGFTSGGTVTESGETEQTQEFESNIQSTPVDVGNNPVDTATVSTTASDSVFNWDEWEQTSGGFRLRKKIATVVTTSAEVQGSTTQDAEAVVTESDFADAQTDVDTQSEENTGDATGNTESAQTADTANAQAAPLSFQDQYYTAADGIVEITTRSETGATHTGSYLFDENGILVTGIKVLTGNESTNGKTGEFYFTAADNAEAYQEFTGKGAALVPWKTNVGQMKKDYWLWSKTENKFHYYGADGKAMTVAQLDQAAKANNTYTGYYKINDEYYCLDANGKPRTGAITLTAKGASAQYYFVPATNAGEIPGKMFRDGWKLFKNGSKEQWKYYDSGELNSAKMGQLLVHGIMVTDLDGRKDAQKSYLLDANGYLLKSAMKKAADGNYYITDKYGSVYKNRLVTYKKKQYYVNGNGVRANWKKGWHRCPGAGNRMYYFGSTAGVIVKKTGWQKVTTTKGKFYGWFYFDKKGNHYTSKLKGGYYFKADGRLASGITVINGKSYFFKPSTSKTRNGKMVKNQMFVYKKKTYFAASNGVLRKSGWQKIDGNWYYFKNLNVVKNTFIKKGKKYGYVDATGKYTTGWVIVDNSKNLVKYINPDKKGFVTNTSKKIDGKLYYFDKNGYRINDLTNIYTGPYTVEVDRVNGVMTVYADSARTIPVKSIRVSVGNPGTPTPTGRYTLTSYSRWQPLMGPSWGQYGTHVNGAGQGGIFVHSIACSYANSYNLPVGAYYKLGSPASHGCIRTCVGDAKWVYNNCNGSTIYIFDGKYKSDEVFKGPLGRRAIVPLKGTKNGGYYDPTDPAA